MARTASQVPKPEQAQAAQNVHEEEHRGTMTIMLIYLVLIVVLCASMFLVLLERS